jgi:hypothetical protein
MPSRRAVLAAVNVMAVGTLGGCSDSFTGEASSDQGGVQSCETTAEARDDSSDLLQEATVSAGDPVVLRVVLDRDNEAFGAFDNLGLLTATGEGYYVPREEATSAEDGPRRVYTQALGRFPQNGRIRVVARTADGESLDSFTVEFTCHRTTPSP